MAKPKVSIIIPVYNVEDYISMTLYSVVHQTLDDLEILVVDDGSSDRSRKLIRAFQDRDPRLELIELGENTPGGAGIPSNRGIDRARGEYIGFVDSDDWVEPDMFQKMYSLAEEHQADVVICDFSLFDEIQKEFEPSYDRHVWAALTDQKVKVLSPQKEKRLLKLSPVPWRKIYRRDLVEKHNLRYPEGDYFFEDNPLHWQTLVHSQKCVLFDEVLCYHRNFRAGQTRNFEPRRLLAFFDHFETVRNYLIQQDLWETYEPYFIEWVVRTDWIYRKTIGTEVEPIMFEKFQAMHNSFSSEGVESFKEIFDPGAATLKRVDNFRSGNPRGARQQARARSLFDQVARGLGRIDGRLEKTVRAVARNVYRNIFNRSSEP